jgi:IclR family acetate operon transcriptional repressor
MKNQKVAKKETTLERTMNILELIGRTSGGLSNSEISHRLNIATSTSCYILERLEEKGFLVRSAETGRYLLGLRILSLCEGALRQTGYRRIAEPALHVLAEETHLSIHIGVLERGRVMIVERAESPDFIKVDVAIGTRLPIHTTAMGKALLSGYSTKEVQAFMEAEGLTRVTSKTIADPSKFFAEIRAVKDRGFATSDEEQFVGIRSVAAPIVDSNGNVYAAVAATGFCAQPIWKDTDRLVQMVQDTARQISRNVSFPTKNSSSR